VKGESIESILKNYVVLLDTLEEINATTCDEYARRAGGQMAKMEKFSTFLGIKLSFLVFEPAERLSETLQSVSTSVQDATTAVDLLTKHYGRLRSDAKFEEFYQHVAEEARSIEEIAEPCLPRKRRLPSRIDDGAEGHFPGSVEDHYRKQYFEVLDLIVQDIRNRFEHPSYSIMKDIEALLLSGAN
jgi:hypothetical protein